MTYGLQQLQFRGRARRTRASLQWFERQITPRFLRGIFCFGNLAGTSGCFRKDVSGFIQCF